MGGCSCLFGSAESSNAGKGVLTIYKWVSHSSMLGNRYLLMNWSRCDIPEMMNVCPILLFKLQTNYYKRVNFLNS